MEEPKKKKFEERYNNDPKYFKYKGNYGYNETRNDVYINKPYRDDVSREDKIYKKDW